MTVVWDPFHSRRIEATDRALSDIPNPVSSLPFGLLAKGRPDGTQEIRDVSVPTGLGAHAPGRLRPPDCSGPHHGQTHRKLGLERNWVDATAAMPEDEQIAAALGQPKRASTTLSSRRRRSPSASE